MNDRRTGDRRVADRRASERRTSNRNADSPRQVLSREEREEQLLEAAATIFAEKGHRATSIADIIERVGVSRGTFYHYFESKEDIFNRLVELYFESFRKVVEENHVRLMEALDKGGDVGTAWRNNVHSILEFHRERMDLSAVIYREAPGLGFEFARKVNSLLRIYKKRVAEEFRALIDRGAMVEWDVDVLASMVYGSVMSLVYDYVLDKRTEDIDALTDQFVRYQLRALSTASGKGRDG